MKPKKRIKVSKKTKKVIIGLSGLKKELDKLVDKRKPIEGVLYKLIVRNIMVNYDLKEIFIPSENIAVSDYLDLHVIRTDKTRYKNAEFIKKIELSRDFVEQLKSYLEPKDRIREILNMYFKEE